MCAIVAVAVAVAGRLRMSIRPGLLVFRGAGWLRLAGVGHRETTGSLPKPCRPPFTASAVICTACRALRAASKAIVRI